ncbi:MAG: STAS domain-containing protein [Sterolibacterium sp.]|nr:STAS domain-containing protein [Sterolibacterium sp.]
MNTTANTERIAIDQDLTIYHAEALKKELMGNLENRRVIELDLSQVAAIDTAGIQLLMLAKRECQKQDKTLRIVAHSPAVHELMDFYNIAGFFGDPLVIPAHSAA